MHGWHDLRTQYRRVRTQIGSERGWEPLVILAVALAVVFALC